MHPIRGGFRNEQSAPERTGVPAKKPHVLTGDWWQIVLPLVNVILPSA